MSHLLVATDFSEVSENAVNYACGLAKDFKTSVTIIHAFIIPVTFSDTPMPVMPIDEGREIAENRMRDVVEKFRQKYPTLNISGKIMFGDIVDCIEEYTETATPWLIIIGNSGNEGVMLWLGSNVLSALKNLKQTVLAIPPETHYKKPAKLCFACDFKNTDNRFIAESLIHLIRQTGAQLHVLNIDHAAENRAANEPSSLHTALEAANPVYHYVEKENVEEGIEEFIAINEMDWLVIIPHQHSFLEGLFRKSHTKAIMKTVHIPLVALHER